MKKRNAIFTIVISLAAIVSFQNCSQTNFEQMNSIDTKVSGQNNQIIPSPPQGELVPIDMDDEDVDADSRDDNHTQIVKEDDGKECDGKDHDHSKDTVKNSDDDKDDAEVHPTNPELGVCVIEGKGNSQKVGFLDDAVAEQPSAAKAICMSRKACLNIVKVYFGTPVKFEIQYCNPIAKEKEHEKDHKRISMSDEELENHLSEQFEVADHDD